MSTRLVAVLLLSFMVIGAPRVAPASPIVNNSGFSSPDRVITFDEIVLPQGTAVSGEYGPSIRLAPHLYFDGQGLASFPGISGHNLANFDQDASSINPFSIVFSSPQTSAAFGMASSPTMTTFTALLGGTVVESFSESTTYNDASEGYYGFTGIVFDEIQVSMLSNLSLLIDNIQLKAAPVRIVTIAAVPEPGSLALVAGALAALALLLKRKKRAANRE